MKEKNWTKKKCISSVWSKLFKHNGLVSFDFFNDFKNYKKHTHTIFINKKKKTIMTTRCGRLCNASCWRHLTQDAKETFLFFLCCLINKMINSSIVLIFFVRFLFTFFFHLFSKLLWAFLHNQNKWFWFYFFF